MTKHRRPALAAALIAIAAGLSLPPPSSADVKFTRLDEDQFVVYHRKHSMLGAEAKAMKTLYTEVASICVAAGFQFFEVKSQEVGDRHYGGLWGGGRGASGSIEAKFHHEEVEDAIECKPLADAKKVELAKKKLAAGG